MKSDSDTQLPRHVPDDDHATVIDRARDYIDLLKPSITFLVLVTALAGSVMALEGRPDWWVILHMLVGTGLCAGGTAALNQYIERDLDRVMRRTINRPLPQGRISPHAVRAYGGAVSLAGVTYLFLLVNPLAAGIGLFTITSYLWIYTPCKRTTWLSTFIGAVPGAMPPVIGWVAVRNELGWGAWVLFAIMFLWQIPHFLAIAWMYRNDYARAGFPVLPVTDPAGNRTAKHILWSCIALLAVSLMPTFLGLTGPLYLAGALILGVAFLVFGVGTARWKTSLSARRLLLASIIYHPLLLVLIAIDATGGPIRRFLAG